MDFESWPRLDAHLFALGPYHDLLEQEIIACRFPFLKQFNYESSIGGHGS